MTSISEPCTTTELVEVIPIQILRRAIPYEYHKCQQAEACLASIEERVNY
jgi:hypothetical protein